MSKSRNGSKTAVHYVKFALAPEGEAALRSVLEEERRPEDVVVELVSTHPRYATTARLSPALVASLAEDLA